MTIECIKYTPVNRGTCVGLASVYVSSWGLDIHGLSVHQKDGKRWLNLPSKEYEKDGEKKYFNCIYFRESDKHKLFCEHAMRAIKEFIKK